MLLLTPTSRMSMKISRILSMILTPILMMTMLRRSYTDLLLTSPSVSSRVLARGIHPFFITHASD
jgi:hypothetical protein